MRITLVFTLFCQAQTEIKTIRVKKPPVDTIDYIYLWHFGGYTLSKVEKKTTSLPHNCRKELFFYSNLDSVFLSRERLIKGQTITLKDTMVDVYWYLIDGVNCTRELCGHTDYFYKLSLNRKNNVMIFEQLFCGRDKRLAKLYFKVIKFSSYELILQEMPLTPVSSRYYFKPKLTVKDN